MPGWLESAASRTAPPGLVAFRDALQHNPRYPDALIGAGSVLFELGQYESALSPLRGGAPTPEPSGRIRYRGDDHRALQGGLGALSSRTLSGSRAHVPTRNPGQAGATSNLAGIGWCYLQLGQQTDARRAFEQALRLQPGYQDAVEDCGAWVVDRHPDARARRNLPSEWRVRRVARDPGSGSPSSSPSVRRGKCDWVHEGPCRAGRLACVHGACPRRVSPRHSGTERGPHLHPCPVCTEIWRHADACVAPFEPPTPSAQLAPNRPWRPHHVPGLHRRSARRRPCHFGRAPQRPVDASARSCTGAGGWRSECSLP